MPNQIDLSGRFAVVTGGAQGIGRSIAERFLDSGAAVAIWDCDEPRSAKTVQDLEQRGRILAFAVDVADNAQVERGRNETLKAFGRIDILVNNAGIGGPIETVWDYPLDAWRQIMKVNLDGPLLLLPCRRSTNDRTKLWPHRQHCVGRRQGGKSQDVCLLRIQGRPDLPHQVTRQGTRELRCLPVNCITPSSAKTELLKQFTDEFVKTMLAKVPRGRFVLVEEIAAMTAFCASADCSFTTGGVFDISGGRATY